MQDAVAYFVGDLILVRAAMPQHERDVAPRIGSATSVPGEPKREQTYCDDGS